MSNSNFYSESLALMRNYYNKKPLNDVHLQQPTWLTPHNPMAELYDKKSVLLQQGQIVYAYLVQANTILFRRFPRVDCPAQIIFSRDPYFELHPDMLGRIAHEMYRYKGKPLDTVPEEWREAIRVITDEHDYSDFTFSVCHDQQLHEYHMIPTIIHRKLLPRGRLCGSIIPVLTTPGCKQVFILPKRYWTRDFTRAWVNHVI